MARRLLQGTRVDPVAAVGRGEEDSDDDEEEYQTLQQKKKKKKKKAGAAEDGGAADSEPPAAAQSAPVKKPKPKPKPKKKKKQEQRPQQESEEEEDEEEIDALLRAHQEQTGACGAAAGVSADEQKLRKTMRVQANALDADRELKMMFGSAVAQARRDDAAGGRKGRNRGQRHAVLAKADGDRTGQRDGISLRCEDGVWTFVETGRYAKLSRELAEVVDDLDSMRWRLRDVPHHVPCLFTFSQAMMTMGDFSAAEDALTQALYHVSMVGEAQGFPWLAPFTERRLACKSPTDRATFAAVRARAQGLTRRGCFRTALEWYKLLWNLDLADPLAGFLCIDFTAAKALQFTWYEELMSHLAASKQAQIRHLARLPCSMYGLALAVCLRDLVELKQEKPSLRSEQLLRDAVRLFPSCVPMLLQEAKAGDDPHAAVLLEKWSPPEPDEASEALCELYATRSGELWRTPGVVPWLVAVAQTVLDTAAFAVDEVRQLVSSDVFVNYAGVDPADLLGKVEVIPEDALADEEPLEEENGMEALMPFPIDGMADDPAAAVQQEGGGGGFAEAVERLQQCSDRIEHASTEVGTLVSLRPDGAVPEHLAAEHARLQEELTATLLQLDSVRPDDAGEGAEEVRQRRKQLVAEALALLKAVDEF
eukprot:TRINITY_DN10150_c2_g1_i1.p1 TRINITY_DN10150_c2_g1~~TRINITY_DN10150_c2_g1_i1.p1  ORF type:complete len:650 (+),score=198.42 TRINITY_DN10150_c2_g1_i1:54-2003(+)